MGLLVVNGWDDPQSPFKTDTSLVKSGTCINILVNT